MDDIMCKIYAQYSKMWWNKERKKRINKPGDYTLCVQCWSGSSNLNFKWQVQKISNITKFRPTDIEMVERKRKDEMKKNKRVEFTSAHNKTRSQN